jgi:hypothetical protein
MKSLKLTDEEIIMLERIMDDRKQLNDDADFLKVVSIYNKIFHLKGEKQIVKN